jgi:hypothetical protein
MVPIRSRRLTMGTWGAGPFQNDDALDWVGGMAQAEDLSALESTLDAVGDSSPGVDARACKVAIAAAEIVARLRGRPGRDLPDEVEQFAHRFDNVPPLLVAKARVAVIRISRSSQLRSLWQESDHLEDWEGAIRNLSRRLLDLA